MDMLRAMHLSEFQPRAVVLALATFVFVLVLWSMAMLVLVQLQGRRRRALLRRLRGSSEESEEQRVLRLWHEGKEQIASLAAAARVPLKARFKAVYRDSGLTASPLAIVGNLVLGAFLVASGLYLVLGRIAPAAFAAILVPLVFWWYLQWRAIRRASIFERQLVDALELSSRALKAGHPLLGSFRLISEEIPAPVGLVFTEICQQQAMGVDLQDALRKVARESRNVDLQLLAASMAINLSCGGNVAEVAEGLATVIRDRMRLNRRFRVLISQTQFSKRILLAMPMIMFVVLNTINPEYMALLYHTRVGNILLASAALSLTMGWWAMNKMASLRT